MEGSKKERIKFWLAFFTVIIFFGSYMIASALHYRLLVLIIMTIYFVGMTTYHYFRLKNLITNELGTSPLIIQKKLFFHKREYIVLISFIIITVPLFVVLYNLYSFMIAIIPVVSLDIILIIWLIINRKQKKAALQSISE